MDNAVIVIMVWGGFLAGISIMGFAVSYDARMPWAWTVFWGVMSLAAIILTIVMIGSSD